MQQSRVRTYRDDLRDRAPSRWPLFRGGHVANHVEHRARIEAEEFLEEVVWLLRDDSERSQHRFRESPGIGGHDDLRRCSHGCGETMTIFGVFFIPSTRLSYPVIATSGHELTISVRR
jgi:hypothetical protein